MSDWKDWEEAKYDVWDLVSLSGSLLIGLVVCLTFMGCW